MADYITEVVKQTAKLDWAFPFQRTGAFPLDRSSLFTSYEDAVLYATGGADSRGLSGSSYVGQSIAVFDATKNSVTLYVIQPNRSLKEVGSGSSSDLETLIQDVKDLKDNFGNVYSKTETDAAIAAAISGTEHLSRKIVNSYDDINPLAEDAHLYIYMVPNGLQENDDKYDEYVVIDNIIERVGSWEVNLDNYATKEEVAKKVDKDENARLMTNAEGDKLATIEQGAQVNVINSISEDFTIDTENNKKLILNNLGIEKITGLQDALNGKVDAQEGYTLLSPDDQKKLQALVIGNDNNLEISGKVNVDNIQGLENWLNSHAANTPGLSKHNLSDDLYTKLDESLFITSIDTSQLQVTNGKLSIIEVDPSIVTGLEDALNSHQTQINNLDLEIDNVIDTLNNFVLKSTYDTDIKEIKDILTWKDI